MFTSTQPHGLGANKHASKHLRFLRCLRNPRGSTFLEVDVSPLGLVGLTGEIGVQTPTVA